MEGRDAIAFVVGIVAVVATSSTVCPCSRARIRHLIPADRSGEDCSTCEADASSTFAQRRRGPGSCNAQASRTACAAHAGKTIADIQGEARAPRLLSRAAGWPLRAAHRRRNPGLRARRSPQTERTAQRSAARGHCAVTTHIGQRHRKHSRHWGEQGFSFPARSIRRRAGTGHCRVAGTERVRLWPDQTNRNARPGDPARCRSIRAAAQPTHHGPPLRTAYSRVSAL